MGVNAASAGGASLHEGLGRHPSRKFLKSKRLENAIFSILHVMFRQKNQSRSSVN